MPASVIRTSTSGSREAWLTVATILVRRIAPGNLTRIVHEVAAARFRGAGLSPERGACGLLKLQDRRARITLMVQRDGRRVTVEVTADGEVFVSHAGSALLAHWPMGPGLTLRPSPAAGLRG
jgi:hypothetical protein